jgi:hypothetical protein
VDLETRIKVSIYRHFAETGRRPAPETVAERALADVSEVVAAYPKLRAQRVLALDRDGVSIVMAPPFSGVPTPHVVIVDEVRYFANCAWDALGIPAALHRRGEIQSRCEQSKEPLRLSVGIDGPEPSTWLFHSLVPAAKWWDDIVFT